MSFKATITSPENQTTWSRVVQYLATIHEDIKFTVTSTELIAWSMNSTDTSMCQVRFSGGFFDEYEFRPQDIVFGEDGLQQIQDRWKVVHKLYSFKINGKHLSILSRKPENDTLKEFKLEINNTTTCPETLANRLQITVHTESLITKEYSPNFTPIKYDPIVIDLKYKKKFLNVYSASPETQEEQLDPRLLEVFQTAEKELSQALFNDEIARKPTHRELTPEDEINYICCNHLILKSFIDNCNTNVTEELKLEISVNKLCMTAFTKGIYSKNNDVLKTAMSMSNTISTSDLEHYCLFTTADEAGGEDSSRGGSKKHCPTKKITFKLKDFKNFINVTALWKSSTNINLLFCHPGDPILMEMSRPEIRIELVQVTDSNQTMEVYNPGNNGRIVKPVSPMKGNRSPLKEPQSRTLVSPRKSPLKPSSPSRNKKLFVRDGDYDDDDDNDGNDDDDDENDGNNNGHDDGDYDERGSGISNGEENNFVNKKSRCKNPLRGKNNSVRGLEEKDEYQSTYQEPTESRGMHVQRMATTIGWGKKAIEEAEERSSNEKPKTDQRNMLKQEKMKYLQELKNKKRKLEKEDELGPTQVDRPKGLFD